MSRLHATLYGALAALIACLTSGSMSAAQAKVTVSNLFVDGGVIQRDKPVNVFGTARPGEIVAVDINGAKGVCIVKESGNFLVSLPPVQGEGPFTLRVAGDNLVEIKNLKAGEVWMVAGDKDADMDSLRAGAPLESADLPDSLQLFKTPIRYSGKPIRLTNGNWIKATSPGAMSFSALGLRLGCDLAKQVGGPIAIIQVSCPDSPIKSWISPQGLLSKPDTAGAPAKNLLKDADYEQAEKDYQEALQKWQQSLVIGQEPPPRPLPTAIVRNNASTLFNGMLAPLTPYSMRGMVWYHGQSDLSEVLNYRAFLSCMFKDFRDIFRQPGLPIILVQTGASGDVQKADDSPVSVLRNVQLKARVWPKTYMAVSLDLDKKDTPVAKGATEATYKVDFDAMAQRITNIALTTQYHTPAAMNYPVVDTIEPVKDGEALKLHLRNSDGIFVKEPAPPAKTESEKDKTKADSTISGIKGFSIGAWNHQFFDADAQLDGDTIVVESKFVKNPKFVRYCWGNSPTPTVFNKNGLPLAPFTSDR